VVENGLSTAKCNPYGHGGGSDSLNYQDCPTQCKGTGDINNKVEPLGPQANCEDSDNGAKDP